MSLLVAKTKEEIKECIKKSAAKVLEANSMGDVVLPDFGIEVPSNREHGDYAVNAAMVWSKTFRKAPRMIAEEIMNGCDFEGTYIKSYKSFS